MPTDAPQHYARVLSIAGSDSGGGAGIQADLKTISALGCYGMTAITAITAQNTCGVRAIHGIPAAMLADQIDAVLEDIGTDAVKIGMLHAPDIVRTVAQAIDRHALQQVVFDPVMVATSGAVLITDSAVDVLVRELFPRATLITPNLDEAALLVRRPLQTEADMQTAAWARARCCSRAGICRATWSATCWPCRAASSSGCATPASTRPTRMARGAPCRLPSPATWRWAWTWPPPCRPRAPISAAHYSTVRRCALARAVAR